MINKHSLAPTHSYMHIAHSDVYDEAFCLEKKTTMADKYGLECSVCGKDGSNCTEESQVYQMEKDTALTDGGDLKHI